jgi:hypothetical protein
MRIPVHLLIRIWRANTEVNLAPVPFSRVVKSSDYAMLLSVCSVFNFTYDLQFFTYIAGELEDPALYVYRTRNSIKTTMDPRERSGKKTLSMTTPTACEDQDCSHVLLSYFIFLNSPLVDFYLDVKD